MARRGRRGGRDGGERGEQLRASDSTYADADGNVLVLRGALTPSTRAAYARLATGEDMRAAANAEDAWHRRLEFLFERLAVSWTIAGTDPIVRQRELLTRFRVASATERDWLRATVREHCAEHFPDLEAP
jgi:hypothetical protein